MKHGYNLTVSHEDEQKLERFMALLEDMATIREVNLKVEGEFYQ